MASAWAMIEMMALLDLTELHTLDGRPWYLNVKQVVSLAPPKNNELLTDKVGCIISLTDAKFVSVTESCEEVRKLLNK